MFADTRGVWGAARDPWPPPARSGAPVDTAPGDHRIDRRPRKAESACHPADRLGMRPEGAVTLQIPDGPHRQARSLRQLLLRQPRCFTPPLHPRPERLEFTRPLNHRSSTHRNICWAMSSTGQYSHQPGQVAGRAGAPRQHDRHDITCRILSTLRHRGSFEVVAGG